MAVTKNHLEQVRVINSLLKDSPFLTAKQISLKTGRRIDYTHTVLSLMVRNDWVLVCYQLESLDILFCSPYLVNQNYFRSEFSFRTTR